MSLSKRLILFGLLGAGCGALSGCSDQAEGTARYARSLRTMLRIQAAERSYHELNSRYAGPEALGIPGLQIVGPGLAEDPVEGYRFRVVVSDRGYQVTSWPVVHRGDAFYSVYSDETGVVRSHFGAEMATARTQRIDRYGP